MIRRTKKRDGKTRRRDILEEGKPVQNFIKILLPELI